MLSILQTFKFVKNISEQSSVTLIDIYKTPNAYPKKLPIEKFGAILDLLIGQVPVCCLVPRSITL